MKRVDLSPRVRRGIVADATLAAGATVLLLQSTSATTRAVGFTVAGVVLVVLGAALLWGVPRPSFRLRTFSSMAGLLLGFALVAPRGPSTWLPLAAGLLLLVLLLQRARRTR